MDEKLDEYMRYDNCTEYFKQSLMDYQQEQEDKYQDELDAVRDLYQEKQEELDEAIEAHEKRMKNKHQLQDDVIDQIAV